MRRTIVFILLLLALPPAPTLHAQGAPDQITAAIEALSQRVGRGLSISDLDNWRWAQEDFGDTSLGCPQPDTLYAQVVTPAYIFTLTYGGRIYDYRVSADRHIVILCSEQTLEEAAAATPTPLDPDFVDPFVLCLNPEPGILYQNTRMIAGVQAQVASGGAPNNLRAAPDVDSGLLAQMPPNAVFTIVAGPECGDGLLWWQVNYDGTIGWTAEGADGEYWLEPIPGRALPPALSLITPANAASLSEQARVELNVIGVLAASRAENAVAVLGGFGSDGLWLFDLAATAELRPRLLRAGFSAQLIAADYSPESLIVLGDTEGNVRIWDTALRAALLERAFLQGHQSDAGAVAFSPDGARVASVGSVANTLAQVEKNNAIILWDVAAVRQTAVLAGHGARVNALAFSPDNTLLVSASGVGMGSPVADNTVRVWDAQTGAALYVLEAHSQPVRAVRFSPDGSLLASADMGGNIILWDTATWSQARTLSQPGGAAALTLAFTPDGGLLASAGGNPSAAAPDNTICLWDPATGAEVARLPGHTGTVGSIAFSADGRVLISVDDERNVRFWGTTQPASVG
jgi:sugar lactone lactonase YvrE